MKTIILKDKLKEGINVVERISTKSLNLPILSNILVSAEKNFLNLATTDLEVGINWWSLVKTEKEGKIAIPARIFAGLVGFLPEKPVELEVEDLMLKVKCGDYQTSIKGLNPEDFPIIPKVADKEKITIKSQVFCQNLSRVADVASFSSAKPEISGIYFLFQKNLIIMAATDSFRLGETKIYLESPQNNLAKDYSLILPQKAAKEIINIFGGESGNLTIYFSPNQILFETGLSETSHPKVQLISRLIEGEYPNYQEIIPKKSETKIALSADEIINQVKSASLFSSKINEIKLKVDPKKNQLNIFSENPDVGEYNSFINAKIDGKPLEVSFNCRFLLDGLLDVSLGKGKEEEIILELNGSDKPGVLRAKGDESYLYLVMPIKTN